MLKNNVKKKILAMILIFTLTFSNLAYVTEALATSFIETVLGIDTGTGHDNVEFEAFFQVGEEKLESVVSDVNNQELVITAQIDVLESGYLKDAKVELVEAEEGKGLNFKTKSFEEMPENLQSAEYDVYEFKQINNYDEISTLVIPIEYKNEEYINENKLSGENIVRFTGIYVDDDGDEVEVSKDVTLRVSWNDKREAKMETSVEKFIQFADGDSKGVILQTLIKVDSTTDKNSLPVKSTEVNVNVPKIGETAPNRVEVIALSTKGTNGKFAEDVRFDINNWSYDADTNVLNIKVENQKELVTVEEFADEFLKELEQEVVEEERYYSVAGIDEYLVTYTYQDLVVNDNLYVLADSTAKLEIFSGDQENLEIRDLSETKEFALTEQTGDIVSYGIENETREVSKTYTYMNYNSDNDYEIEYKTKNIINVSYKDIIEELIISDVGNEYLFKDGMTIPNQDTVYKEVSLDKNNMLEILGEDGKVEILDEANNSLVVIDKNTEVTEENKISITFNTEYKKLIIKTSKPIAEGNLVINTVKVSKDASILRDEYVNAAALRLMTNLKAKYTYVDELVDIGNMVAETTLVDTVTTPNIMLDRDSLSTLSRNENVEIRIELNNDKENTDPYGNSTFDILMPEYVENVEVTNATLAYAEGLNIANTEVLKNEAGRFVIRVTLSGKQESLNTGVLTNGTNIEIYANIDVNLYAPAKEAEMVLHVSNEFMTNTVEDKIVKLYYSAPTGLVTVNSTSNYNNIGSVLTSIRQGIKTDLIDIYSDAKVAKMELIIMNNNGNTVSNIAILGRIPFEGVKDILSGNDLGTTLDTRLVSGITPDVNNKGTFTIYYSENKEATRDLNDPNNGWTLNPESLNNMKSYLIVPEDTNYVMETAEILRFTYEYEIPGNLPHNEDIFGTFLTYYTNNSEILVSDETSAPDIIGLTTGDGPELEIELTSDTQNVNEFEDIKVTSKIKNIGNDVARDIVVSVPMDDRITFKSAEQKDNVLVGKENDKVTFSINELAPQEEIDLSAVVKVNEQNEADNEENELKFVAVVTAKDLGKEIISKELIITINQAELAITGSSSSIDSIETDILPVGFDIKLAFTPENLTSRDLSNLEVKVKLPDNVTYKSASLVIPTLTEPIVEEKYARYDESTRVVTWNLDKLEAYGSKVFRLEVVTSDIPDGKYKLDGSFIAEAKADGTKTYTSNEQVLTVGKTSLSVHQETLTDNTYVKAGDDIKYKFVIRNEGAVIANDVVLTDILSDGLNIRSLSYKIGNGAETTRRVFNNDAASINLDIPAETTAEVIVVARANTVGDSIESTVENYGNMAENDGPIKETNKITHIVQSDGEKMQITEDNKSSNPNINSSNSSSNGNVVKTYKVTGTAWLDSNSNGSRDNDESKLSGVQAKLVNSETGVIVKTAETDSKGEYSFAGVENGNYLIVFDYDTVKYTVTTYQKSGVEANINSDAITTKIEQEGRSRNGAVTDVVTVKDSTVSNIDIGFVLADTFDLELEKSISKVTVQNSAGTTTNEFENSKLAQVPIAARQLSTSEVYVEYKIKVSNVGDVAGYAKKIVDYIPEGMTFMSDLNPDWYTGTDGNLYTTALEDTQLTSGETRELKLVLTKKMTEENTGLVNNTAEIYEDYNIYGISDKNSTPGNKAQGENDLGLADLIITVRTGEVFIHVSVIITTVLLGSIVVFVVYTKIVLRRKKGGV